MQISKSRHLRRLLQTQDVFLSGLAYVATVWAGNLLGIFSDITTNAHLQLVPVLLLFSVGAMVGQVSGLKNIRALPTFLYAARLSVIVVAGMLATAYFGKLTFVSRLLLGTYAIAVVVGIVANRLFLAWWYFSGRKEHHENYLKVLIVGSGNRAQQLIRTYQQESEWGIDIIGALDPEPNAPHDVEVPLLGQPRDIRRILETEVVDEIVVCVPRRLLDNVGEIVDACVEQGVCIKFLADLYDVGDSKVGLEMIGGIPTLTLNPVSSDVDPLIVKRIVDLMITIPALVVLTPLLALTALAIKLDSRGPVFFSQKRVGLNKRRFNMIKFRSMYRDAEARLAEIEHLNEASGPIFKMKNDPRVTRVGRFIRRASIDELPQLFNVLLGHMSVIGPRPMSVRDVQLFSLGVQRKRFSVRPGLACLREVKGRSRLSFDRWLELDLQYIDDWTLWLDIKILFLLIPAVIRGDGAT